MPPQLSLLLAIVHLHSLSYRQHVIEMYELTSLSSLILASRKETGVNEERELQRKKCIYPASDGIRWYPTSPNG